ncbi:DUF1329 domain-containing protein [Castellaniella sp. GW247-6E4]|uniref:DUF1329 domain-containing protein n=1 Tax=Castellaniella sp. GW247-6E4 TaxID=3140380 RepID=UPI0033149074
MTRKVFAFAAMIALAVSNVSLAAVSVEEAGKLGTTLTPWGAIQAGNKEGTIPAYTGPIAPPADYDPGKPGLRPDPFAAEKPLFSITAANVEQYADKLAEGAKEMLRKYPTYRLDIYPSHRTANYPGHYLENSIKNATQCETEGDGLQLVGCVGGLPFPIPKTGSEIMWNRAFQYDAYALKFTGGQNNVMGNTGKLMLAGGFNQWLHYPILDPKNADKVFGRDAYYMKNRADWKKPARKAGEIMLVLESVDMVNIGRRAWQYLPGQRRVKLSPDLSYDTPSPVGGGALTMDDNSVFLGALDRYDWKLLGKKEMFIPYNSYKISDPKQCSSSVSYMQYHLNPDCVRWELHRVWVVEANLKPGKRHVYPRRVFYWDEDLPAVGMGDNYDAAGKVYRFSHGLPITLYETKGHVTTQWVTYDLATGVYARQQDLTDEGSAVVLEEPPSNTFYSPEAIASAGVR